jgi:hypothetical protein
MFSFLPFSTTIDFHFFARLLLSRLNHLPVTVSYQSSREKQRWAMNVC